MSNRFLKRSGFQSHLFELSSSCLCCLVLLSAAWCRLLPFLGHRQVSLLQQESHFMELECSMQKVWCRKLCSKTMQNPYGEFVGRIFEDYFVDLRHSCSKNIHQGTTQTQTMKVNRCNEFGPRWIKTKSVHLGGPPTEYPPLNRCKLWVDFMIFTLLFFLMFFDVYFLVYIYIYLFVICFCEMMRFPLSDVSSLAETRFSRRPSVRSKSRWKKLGALTPGNSETPRRRRMRWIGNSVTRESNMSNRHASR